MSAISTMNLTKSFGEIQALQGISFNIPEGSISGFLGPNGAGKTTTIGIIMQLIFPDTGSVTVFDDEIKKGDRAYLQDIGFIPDAQLPEIKAKTFLKHTAKLLGFSGSDLNERLNSILLSVDAMEFVEQNTNELSKGQKQRIKIANSLLGDPKLIIADEPTAGLDPISRQTLLSTFKSLVKEEGKTIFFSNHVISEVEKISDHIILLDQGRIVKAGKLKDILTDLSGTNKHIIEVRGIAESDLSILPGVIAVEHKEGDQFIISTEMRTEEQTPEFLGPLVSNQKVLVKYYSRNPVALEDIFKGAT